MKRLFNIITLPTIFASFILFVGTLVYRANNFERVEMPIISLQDAVEIDSNIYLGNGFFKIIQAYDLNGKFIKTIDARGAGPYFTIVQSDLGEIVALRDDSRYYDLPFERTRNYQYLIKKKLPLALRFRAASNDVEINQSLRTFLMVPFTWIVFMIFSLLFFIVLNLELVSKIGF